MDQELGQESLEPLVDAPSDATDSGPADTEAHPEPLKEGQVQPDKELSFKDKMLDIKEKAKGLKEKPAADKTPAVVAPIEPQAEAPKFEANLKYKVFGKEKELDPFFASLIKDSDSEKKVKDVFTKADAFEDMKYQKESINAEFQKVSQQYGTLDKDVRRITGYLNNGDTDNFFKALGLSDDQLLQHLQKKAEISRMSPVQQQAYNDAVNSRANDYNREIEHNQMRTNYEQQAVQIRTMQLDHALGSSAVQSAAQSWDAKMGSGSFRQLVIDEGANIWRTTNQDVPPEHVAQMVLQKFGKLLEQSAPQAPVVQAPAPGLAPQATVAVGAKPVIPGIAGRGASPIKQAPKSLDELKKLGAKMRQAEMNPGDE